MVEKLTRFSSRTTFNNRKSNVVVSLFSIQAFQRRAIKITINKSATLRNHLAFYKFNSPSHDLSSKKTEP